jgi:N-acetylglucosaminyldiphosphoundecaprenol N-acetyl-beta-D-mannosaminyltransferase
MTLVATPSPCSVPTFRLYRGEAASLLAGLIVTPNLDHLRLLAVSAALRHAYAQADVVLNDSRFLDRLALRGRALCWPGSDLAPMMLTALAPGARVAVIGGGPAVQAYLADAFAAIDFVFLEPSMGYIRRRAERRALVATALAAGPEIVFVCTGAPRSELLAAQLKRAGYGGVILCCGSAFHFLAGAKRRAPKAFQRLGAEWLWRFASEAATRRRYLADAVFLLRHAGAFLRLRRGGEAGFGRYCLTVGSVETLNQPSPRHPLERLQRPGASCRVVDDRRGVGLA